MALINTILNILFPVNCLVCGRAGKDLCFKCLSEISPPDRPTAEWVYPIFDYRDKNIKKAIWLLKYSGKKTLAKTLAQVLHEKIIEELADLSVFENFREPILVPIPLAPKRLRERGFNQAELICRELIKLDKAKNLKLIKNILVKPKDTEHQAKIEDRMKRLRNVIGSFFINNPEFIRGQNIILIDDVTTTGATLNEAKKVLREAGAKKVIAFTIAH